MTNQNSDMDNKIRYISHEIRNHLSICDMYTQIIKRNLEKLGIKNDSIENALECIQQSVQIIGMNILDLRSMSVNGQKIYSFKNLVLKATEMAKAYVLEKNIIFDVFVKSDADVFVDENRILACIVNIIKNGIEAIDLRGEIKIYGEIRGNCAILKISNDGKPISKDSQAKIFDTGYTTKDYGSGLGLGICREYLKSQNADIRLVKSGKTETQFEINIPVYNV